MTEQEPITVFLGKWTFPRVETEMSATIDDRGLTVEGRDVGIGVVEIWDDPVYEYSVNVGVDHLDRMLTALRSKLGDGSLADEKTESRNRLILDSLKEAFSKRDFHNSTDFRQWLQANDFPSDMSDIPPG